MTFPNTLLIGMNQVENSLHAFKEHARLFYFDVLMSIHPCPHCGGKLRIVAASKAKCTTCSTILDPTLEFQRSPCCNAKLRQKTCHYICVKCSEYVPSMYLFDERLYTPEYFKEKMWESRERKRQRCEELRKILTGSRSNQLLLPEFPDDNVIEDLALDLNRLAEEVPYVTLEQFRMQSEFRMEEYRKIILSSLDGCAVRFSTLPTIETDQRLERARLFITLIFMEQDREVWLESQDNDIMVIPYAND